MLAGGWVGMTAVLFVFSQARMRGIRKKFESVSLFDEIFTLAVQAEYPSTVVSSVEKAALKIAPEVLPLAADVRTTDVETV
jgi:hypothetical protein